MNSSLLLRDSLDLVEEDVSILVGDMMGANTIALYFADSGKSSLATSVPSVHSVKLPGSGVAGQCYEKNAIMAQKIGAMAKKVAVPIEGDNDNHKEPIAVLVLEIANEGSRSIDTTTTNNKISRLSPIQNTLKKERQQNNSNTTPSPISVDHEHSTLLTSISTIISANVSRIKRNQLMKSQLSSTIDKLTHDLTTTKHFLSRKELLNKMSAIVAHAEDTHSLFEIIVDYACSFMIVERAKLLLYDTGNRELYGAENERIPHDSGIAGETLVSKKFVNVLDAYRDVRFDRDSSDSTSTTSTPANNHMVKSLLSFPLINPTTKEIVGVLQVFNKLGESNAGSDAAPPGGAAYIGDNHHNFNTKDEKMLEEFVTEIQGAVVRCLEVNENLRVKRKSVEDNFDQQLNSKMCAITSLQSQLTSKTNSEKHLSSKLAKSKSIMDLSVSVATDLSIAGCFTHAVNNSPRIMNCARATLFLIDKRSEELYSVRKSSISVEGGSETELRIPLNSGIAGFVAKTSQLVNLSDPYSDPRFNSEVDAMTGFTTESILCGPIKDEHFNTIGVLQVRSNTTVVTTPKN